MFNSKKFRITLFILIVACTFTIWFGDGYMQWVNSDTAGEAYATTQQINFPQGLVSQQSYHARITAAILTYIPFHTVGILFREFTNDPVTAIYVSQGVMTGVIFLLLVIISAAYVSISAPLLSTKYLISAVLLMLFTMSMPAFGMRDPITLTLRFGHQAVMCHYVGTMVIALFAVFPYWHYLFYGEWEAWYTDAKYRTIFYLFIIAGVFSTTGTMIWMATFAATTILSLVLYTTGIVNKSSNFTDRIKSLLTNPKVHPLILIVTLFFIGVIFESTTQRGGSAIDQSNIFEYVKIYVLYFASGSMLWFSLSCLAFIALMVWEYKKGSISRHSLLLMKIFPWLLVGNLIFIFFIGLPAVSYRFAGYNLGADTVFPATWTMALWLVSVILEYWRQNKLLWLSPVILFILITHSITFLDFPSHWYELKERQKNIFSTIRSADEILPMDIPLPLPAKNVAFSESELKKYAIPMLRKSKIVSSNREIWVVSQKVYESWLAKFSRNEVSSFSLLEYYDESLEEGINFSKPGYPNFLKHISGMSGREDWGRWTDANKGPTKFQFKKQLPEQFTLELKALASEPNIGLPVKVRIGNIEKTFILPDKSAKVFRLHFNKVKNADTIELIPPKPMSPSELNDQNKDTRKLGLRLSYLKILKNNINP